jgi:hypothetical protein
MPSLQDVRALALSFPETFEKVDGHRGGASWRTKGGLFVWERGPSKTDLAALADLGRAWPEGEVVGVRTDGSDGKEALLKTFPDVFFTIPHFDGYPAVLVRLAKIDAELLREVVTDAWILRAPKRVSRAWIAAEHG